MMKFRFALRPAAAPSAHDRRPGIDLARGLAVLAMVLYHLSWDLGYFRLVPVDLAGSQTGRALAHVIAMSFLALVGISLILASARTDFYRRFWRRLGMVGLGAASISLATFLFMPQDWIFFGILHNIFISSLIGLLLIEAPLPLLIALSFLALALPSLLASPIFDPIWLVWLGLGETLPRTNDFAPLFPGLAAVLAGMVYARLVLRRPQFANDNRPRRQPNPLMRALLWCGRHSLAIYLLHQPILFGLFLGTTSLLPHETPFEAEFRRQCHETGGSDILCAKAFACLRRDLETNDLWTATIQDRLDVEGRARLTDFALACGRKIQNELRHQPVTK